VHRLRAGGHSRSPVQGFRTAEELVGNLHGSELDVIGAVLRAAGLGQGQALQGAQVVKAHLEGVIAGRQIGRKLEGFAVEDHIAGLPTAGGPGAAGGLAIELGGDLAGGIP
jgi:hypothetical protein